MTTFKIGENNKGQLILTNGFSFEDFKEISHIENIINSLIDNESNYVWFEDEKGQRFVPSGKIYIGLIEGLTYISE